MSIYLYINVLAPQRVINFSIAPFLSNVFSRNIELSSLNLVINRLYIPYFTGLGGPLADFSYIAGKILTRQCFGLT